MASSCQVSPAELECAICCELLIDPRSLTCSHTFCMQCLIRLHQSKQDEYSVDCPLCRQVTCLEDGDLSSLQPNLELQTAVTSLETKNQSLKGRVEARLNTLFEHVSLINDVEDAVSINVNRAMTAIEAAFNDNLQSLSGKNDELAERCLQYKHDCMSKLSIMRESSGDMISRISSVFEKISDDSMILLEGEALAIHESAQNALLDLLEQNEPDASEVNAIAEQSGNVKFKRFPGQSVMDIGVLEGIDQTSAENVKFLTELPVENWKVGGMVMMPNERVALGYRTGGIQFFSKDREQEKVLEDIQVWALARFWDGCFVVRDRDNNVMVFTQELERQSRMFETLTWEEGGQGGINVDSHKNIYVSYCQCSMIQVFKEDGGNPIKELSCDFVPYQFCIANNGRQIFVQDGPTLQVIDEGGVGKHEITKEGVVGYPALDVVPSSGDDVNLVLIAWVDDKLGIVSIDRYTDTLRYKDSLVTDYKVDSSWPSRCFLNVSDNGLVAFYRNSHLYFFQILWSARCCIL
ncbi:uncharacterized protein LOC129254145 [Lytechinus pictus]|uniref:uncharacterized protein LOC129254145 n=1 Tax=Lytechinus pictus TaxID=7653 RepID=UPI0030BA19EF